ncbi:MAG TPA: sigma-54 factor interaction domain-containing protein [Bryobacteraceae bacterium]|nr:sigma-54 factor interaction domain-containing protein [Bryobacteraceae bacterium]
MYILCMPILKARDRHFLESSANLGYCNPFLPERVEFERAALGREFVDAGPVWSPSVSEPDAARPNIVRLHQKLPAAIEAAREALSAASDVAAEELTIYEECVHTMLYQRYYDAFVSAGRNYRFYRAFLEDWNRLCHIPGKNFTSDLDPAHVFACFRQIQRAFGLIYGNIIGNSMAAARLRASIWQSIFTHDMRRYRRILYRRMGDFPTLITGPSGTGKELIARAIAGSRYIPFDPERIEFADGPGEAFLPINIAALSPTLIESELFGHRKGSFTGAVGDRKGWLESCSPAGSVFLDELGEMDLSLQVKLLRVIETRKFSPVGETATRDFRGKLIAATNRALPVEIRAGRFREDLYYRLCADLIRTPPLADQIRDSPSVLHELIYYMTLRTVGDEAEQCLPDVEAWIRTHLPADYAWPGNYRELEQCVRNVIIRRSYQPIPSSEPATGDDFFTRYRAGKVTADEVLSHYAAHIYRLTGSFEEAARRLNLDRRTVKKKVEAYLVAQTRTL